MENDKTLVVFNVVSGRGKTKKFITLIKEKILNFKTPVEFVYFSDILKFKLFIKENQDKFNKIIVVGGDGTIFSLINSEITKNHILGIIPTGSGNDFAYHSLNLKKDIDFNLHRIFNNGAIIYRDICDATIYESDGNNISFNFINSLGAGFDAAVADNVKNIKNISGLLLYLVSVFITLKNYNCSKLFLQLSNHSITSDYFMLSLGNGKTAGGGFKLTPLSVENDGYFDVCFVKKVSKSKVLFILPKAINGKHLNEKEIIYFRDKYLVAEFDKPQIIHADGEILSRNAIKIIIQNKGVKLKFIA